MNENESIKLLDELYNEVIEKNRNQSKTLDRAFSKVVREARGERTIREYADAAGVSPSNISRIERGMYRPKPEMIVKLTSSAAEPRGGITFEDMMVACGYHGDYSHADMHIDVIDIEEQNHSMMARNEEVKAREYEEWEERRRNRIWEMRENQKRFEKKSMGIIYSAIASKNYHFDKVKDSSMSKRGYNPDVMLNITAPIKFEWNFDFCFMLDKRNMPYRAKTRSLERVLFIEANPERLITLVTNSIDYYEFWLSWKDKLAYRGNLSILLVDTDKFEILREDYISHFDLETNASEIILMDL